MTSSELHNSVFDNKNDDDDDQRLGHIAVVEQSSSSNELGNNPPDSFWVAKDEELDWLSHNAFMQRKGSLKVILSKNFDPSSQRSISLTHKPKTSIIELPKSTKFSTGGDGRRSHGVGGGNGKLMFRSRSVPGENRTGHVSEPGSPSVSCMGRVGSRRKKTGKSRFWAVLKSAFVNRRENQPVE